MSTIEINKIVGAILMAVLLALGLSFAVELITGAEHGDVEPVFVVEVAEADEAGAESPNEVTVTIPTETVVSVVEEAAESVEAVVEEAAAVVEEVAEAASSLVAAIAAADIAQGEKAFKKCKACHTVEDGGNHRIGPNLWGVVGATQARHPDFKYSRVLADLGGSWDYAALDAFLTKPKDYARGTKMAFPGLADAGARAAVIAYLRTLSASPAPLGD